MEFKKKTIIWEENNEPPKNYIWVKDDGKAYEYDHTTRQWVESETIYVLLAQVDNISDLITILASEEHTFSSDQDYSAGETVLKEGKLYMFTEDHAAGEWNEEEVEETSILDILDVSSNKMINITWAKLKDLRDNSKLVPGALYRITDYECTTSQDDTCSAGHQFDIIVQALSESILSEDAKAIQHEVSIDDMPKYCMNDLYNDITTLFGTVTVNGVVYYSYRNSVCEFLIDVNNLLDGGIDFDNNYPGYRYAINANLERRLDAEEYNGAGNGLYFSTNIKELFYFSNSNLAAWKLKYCLDNDEERFAWARGIYLSPLTHNKFIRVLEINAHISESFIYVRQPQLDNENGVVWAYDKGTDSGISIKNYANYGEDLDTSDIIYTQSENIYIGQNININGVPGTIIDFSENQGKGVIYQMIDEYNNDCPYDFKNIQFLRSTEWLQEHEDWTTIVNNELFIDSYYYTFSIYNHINDEEYLVYDASIQNESLHISWKKVFNNKISSYIDDFSATTLNKQILNNIIIVSYFNSHLELSVYNNTFNNNCHDISATNEFLDNIFENSCENIVLSSNFNHNILRSGTNTINANITIYSSVFKGNKTITITMKSNNLYISNTTIDSSVEATNIPITRTVTHSYIYCDSEETIYIDKIYTAFDRT